MTHRTESDLMFRGTIRLRRLHAPRLCLSSRRRCLVYSLCAGRM